MNRKILFIQICALIFFLSACSGGYNDNPVIETGSDIKPDGSIKSSNLTFHFKDFNRERKVKDLFNYIYFEGDTICFSTKIRQNVTKDMIKVNYLNPENGNKLKAERLEVKDNRIYGYSLLGSILEKFYGSKLEEPIPESRFCCKDIPFVIQLEIKFKGKVIKTDIKKSFRLVYK